MEPEIDVISQYECCATYISQVVNIFFRFSKTYICIGMHFAVEKNCSFLFVILLDYRCRTLVISTLRVSHPTNCTVLRQTPNTHKGAPPMALHSSTRTRTPKTVDSATKTRQRYGFVCYDGCIKTS